MGVYESVLKEFLTRESDQEWFVKIKQRVLQMEGEFNYDEALLRKIFMRESDKEWLDRIRRQAREAKKAHDDVMRYMY